MSAEHLLSGLDAQQREAVTTTAAPLAVVAAAGSGKTRVLTSRIAYRVLEGTAHPRHVLALTFTRDAASEMKRRLRRLDIREPIDAGTFHSVALRLLRDRALARQQPAPQVADDRIRLMRECLTQLQLRAEPFAALADLDWARARMIEPSRFDAACRAARRRSAIPASRYAELVEVYTALKKRRGVVDFDDLLTGLLHALSTDRPWAEAVRWRYRHFFVDEAQDMNPLQLAVLNALRDDRPDLCLVGDPRQAIYGWNGADHTTLSEVERVFPGVTVVALSTNYRCSPQVVQAAAAALGASGQHDTTQSFLDDARQVTVSGHADEHAEAEAVALHIRGLLHHVSGRQLAVLARTNDQLAVLQQAFTRHGLTTERSVGRSPLEAAVRAATRCTNREQLARWVDDAFAGDDPEAQRVAEEADRFLSSGE
ncbi:MAG: ATP-dependent helicase, partial [Actinomycetota bacterium]